jgi:hypothetical protein
MRAGIVPDYKTHPVLAKTALSIIEDEGVIADTLFELRRNIGRLH